MVDPWGKILNQIGLGAGVIFADIDLLRLQKIRQNFPCIDHHVLVKGTK